MPITFAQSMNAYALGRRVNMEEWNTITRIFETAAQLGFGVPVRRGAGAKGCVAYVTGSADIIGITEASQVLPHAGDYYERYENVPVCESGVIGVLAGETTVLGGPAGYDPTANSGAGGWMNADTAAPAIPGATFESVGGVGTVVALRYRRPNE
jgi:hypothetical protein